MGFFQSIEGTNFSNKAPALINLDFLQLNATFDNITIQNFSVAKEPKLLQLQDGGIAFNIADLVVNVTTDYGYVSEPPIFADLGQTIVLLDDLMAKLLINFNYEDGALALGLDDLEFSVDELDVVFDGLSDTSVLLSNTLKDLQVLIGSRLSTLLKFRKDILKKTLEPKINKAL